MSLTPVKILVPISGGKDSQACLKLALQQYPAGQVRGLFCDTQWEHSKTYQHVERLRSLYGDIIIDTTKGAPVLDLCLKYGRFPGGGARFCTDETKIRPTKRYCWWLATLQGQGFEVWYGMRSGESKEREKRYFGKVNNELYPPHEVIPSKYPKYLAAMGVMFRLPILDWTESEVLSFLGKEVNPLYLPTKTHSKPRGRVGCNPCLAGGDASKEQAFEWDDEGRTQYIKASEIAKAIGKPVYTSKSGKKKHPESTFEACAICQI